MSEAAVSSDIRQEANSALMEVDKGKSLAGTTGRTAKSLSISVAPSRARFTEQRRRRAVRGYRQVPCTNGQVPVPRHD